MKKVLPASIAALLLSLSVNAFATDESDYLGVDIDTTTQTGLESTSGFDGGHGHAEVIGESNDASSTNLGLNGPGCIGCEYLDFSTTNEALAKVDRNATSNGYVTGEVNRLYGNDDVETALTLRLDKDGKPIADLAIGAGIDAKNVSVGVGIGDHVETYLSHEGHKSIETKLSGSGNLCGKTGCAGFGVNGHLEADDKSRSFVKAFGTASGVPVTAYNATQKYKKVSVDFKGIKK